MYNLIKFEFYKLRHSRAFKNSAIVIIGLILWSIKIFFTNTHKCYVFRDSFRGQDFGLVINNFKDRVHPKAIEFFYSTIGFMPIVEIIVICLVAAFVANEYSNGTIKNTVAYGHKRIFIYISKLLTLSLGIFILIFTLLFGAMFLGSIATGGIKTVSINDILEMAKITFLIWFILFSMISIYMCLSVAIVNKSVVIGFGITAMFLSLIYVKYACIMLNMYHPNYIPTYMLLNFDNLNSETSYSIIINCIILIVSTTLLGGFIFEKQDIK